jgi:uncharacterized protein
MSTAPLPATPADDASTDLAAARLAAALRRHGRLLVAFSGGVDSALVLQAAVDALGPERVLAVTGVSPSLARRELDEAKALATRIGAPHRLLATRELEDPRYAANPADRCYFCKSELYERLRELAAAEGWEAIADGTNADDTRDVRPGRRAAAERGVVSPLLEAGLGKDAVRALSRRLGLPTWDKPEMPCLSSRIPYGSAVDPQKLRQIEVAEECLRAAGVRGGRVRHHGDLARVELPPADLGRLADRGFRERIVEGIRHAGFRYVTLDLEGYRKGRLNEALAAPVRFAAGQAPAPVRDSSR